MPCVYCVLCGNRDKSVSYHGFPKQEEIRKQWLAFCGIKENVLNTVTKLCSNHFCDEDLKMRVKGVSVIRNSVPCFHTRKRKMQSISVSNDNESTTTKIKCIVTDNSNVLNNISVTSITQSSKCQTPLQIKPEYSVGIGTSDSSIKEEELRQVVTDSPSTPSKDEAIEDSNFRTPTKAIFDPRFVGSIRTPHLATPRRARRALDLAKRTIAQQRKIKTLQQARNRKTTSIRTMKDLIKHLQHKNLLSETAAEKLKVNEI